ncbi:MAG: mshA4 [Mycobacterium sp.]|jgi:glycosyltransferase involved in cell wall biosynthesis|nr:mshA4 [Mycobacterium sp.]
MRVGLVGTWPAPSTGQADVADGRLGSLADALTRRGADVTIYAVRPPVADAGAADANESYRVVSMTRPELTADTSAAALAPVMGDFIRFLDARWQVDRPHVVHASSWLLGVAAQLAADRHAVASVQSISELSSTVRHKQGRVIGPASRGRLERLVVRAATRVTAACAEDQVDVIRLGCRRSHVSILPHAVDTKLFTPGPSRDDGDGAPRLVTVARELAPHKGIEDVIVALTRLPAAELIVVGGPSPDEVSRDARVAQLRDLAVERGVAGRVHFVGRQPIDRLPAILRTSDAFVSASWYEPFGLPVVEAMACGLPVVASATGGMLDTVINDVTGVLVPPRRPARLAAALASVLHGGALRRGMGYAGCARAQSRYAWDRIAAETYSLYEQAITAADTRRLATSATRLPDGRGSGERVALGR